MRCKDCIYYSDGKGICTYYSCYGWLPEVNAEADAPCEGFESRDGKDVLVSLVSFGNVAPNGTELITCDECKYQSKIFCSDARYIEGGYYIYRCLLNDNPFERHAVDGYSDEYCSSAVKRGDDGE